MRLSVLLLKIHVCFFFSYDPAFFPVPFFSFCFHASRSQTLSCFLTLSLQFTGRVFCVFSLTRGRAVTCAGAPSQHSSNQK